MDKKQQQKIDDLILCDNCKISISNKEYIDLIKTKTTYRENGSSCEYSSRLKLCLKCGEKEWNIY
jgi:hypothetical protein